MEGLHSRNINKEYNFKIIPKLRQGMREKLQKICPLDRAYRTILNCTIEVNLQRKGLTSKLIDSFYLLFYFILRRLLQLRRNYTDFELHESVYHAITSFSLCAKDAILFLKVFVIISIKTVGMILIINVFLITKHHHH